ncbi:winged helix-turn-helix domain-containing protein [Streptomyces sp. SM1]|uniref:winged helix-turn-helix domain-containing protein n=1 Tax=Streptomyces sp. SM1 TaxID=402229 RepID=UPI000CD5313B|nr:winged helix-turn-helix domain-containing protein [Streptomyces sp. SM1]
MGFSGAAVPGSRELEARRLDAAGLFEQGVRQVRVAERLGVSRQAVSQWHAAWRAGGVEALAARYGNTTVHRRLTDEQEAELVTLLRQGPTAHGWDDQRWTLARISRLVQERYGPSYSPGGMWQLLRRLGWSWQVPQGRAIQWDEEAIAAWCTETWPAVSHPGER